MNRWIEEFKQIIKDESIIKYYEEEILMLEKKDYEYICKMIGNPKKVAKIEVKNETLSVKENIVELKNLTFMKNYKHSLFILLPLIIIFLITFILSLFTLFDIYHTTFILLSKIPNFIKNNMVVVLIYNVCKLLLEISTIVIIYFIFNFVVSKFEKKLINYKDIKFISACVVAIISLIAIISLMMSGSLIMPKHNNPHKMHSHVTFNRHIDNEFEK